jgi:hypothetical protein
MTNTTHANPEACERRIGADRFGSHTRVFLPTLSVCAWGVSERAEVASGNPLLISPFLSPPLGVGHLSGRLIVCVDVDSLCAPT